MVDGVEVEEVIGLTQVIGKLVAMAVLLTLTTPWLQMLALMMVQEQNTLEMDVFLLKPFLIVFQIVTLALAVLPVINATQEQRCTIGYATKDAVKLQMRHMIQVAVLASGATAVVRHVMELVTHDARHALMEK